MRRGFAIAVAVLMGAPHVASAGDVVVVESYGEARPDDADPLLAPLYRELASLGHLAPGAFADRLREIESTSGVSPSAEAITAVVEQVERGYDGHWLSGEFARAVEVLGPAVTALLENPAWFAEDQSRRDLLLKAHVGLALSHSRLGNSEEATRAMAEVLRSYPDKSFNRSQFGPEAHDLYRGVQRELSRLDLGTLEVTTDDESLVVFVNERFIGTGDQRVDLIPGRYRVFVKKGSVVGRVHAVAVNPGETARVSVAWSLDSSLRTSDGVVALQFASDGARERDETALAIRLARSIDASGVVLVGIRQYDGRRAMIGALLSLDSGKARRSATLALEPAKPGDADIRALARYLALGEPNDALTVIDPSAVTVVVDPKPAGRPYRAWKWLALTTGVAAVAGGAVFVAIDGPILDDEGNHTPNQYDTATSGYVLGGVGLALVVTGVVLWIKDKPAPEPTLLTIVPMPGGVAVGFGGTF